MGGASVAGGNPNPSHSMESDDLTAIRRKILNEYLIERFVNQNVRIGKCPQR